MSVTGSKKRGKRGGRQTCMWSQSYALLGKFDAIVEMLDGRASGRWLGHEGGSYLLPGVDSGSQASGVFVQESGYKLKIHHVFFLFCACLFVLFSARGWGSMDPCWNHALVSQPPEPRAKINLFSSTLSCLIFCYSHRKQAKTHSPNKLL